VKRGQILRIIGDNIRKERLRRRMTQEGLAEVLGIHWKTLGYIEAGKRDFGASTLAMIIARLKVPSSALFQGLPKMDDAEITVILQATARKRKPRTTSRNT
jgi:transcriptional regulator with XRE-family HTH domain